MSKCCTPTICMFLDSRGIGGIESHVLQLSAALQAQGYSVRVLFWKDYGQQHPLHTQLISKQIQVIYLNGSIARLRSYVLKQGVSVLHCHGYKASILARLFCRTSRVRLVSSYHAAEACTGALAFYTKLDFYSARLSDANISVSLALQQQVKGTCVHIDNFVNINPVNERPLRLKRPQIAFVGRVVAVKAPQRVLELAAHLPGFDFLIYGHGDMEHQLKQSSPANVIWKGQVKNMQSHWKQIDLLCLTSLQEGLPMAVLEAMANKVPVMTTKVGGLASLIEHRRNGYMFEHFNALKWSETLLDWQSLSKSQAEHLQRQARASIEQHYSAKALLPRFQQLYGC
ncbi:glycosyltransferase family 1 protein [Alginatibacterium sediminis]|uniref:Glycosyltransferase family 1 protein n=1 Tax=Alginatibacterium sediminis TaxID=2164068 RepID=A0A420EDN3_9ALTE|nr:glycosyltransferase family 4 protein [Alginatibacterium sediminis]RKF18783.1 glycosyltransferase family 1 protein [Alginatibacterium sediminis]